jgi:phosphatidate phosphatase LPIN
MPHFGKDWSQPNIADLYQKIVSKGYQILYLTARAIGQTEATKKYIFSIRQNGVPLPFGPVIQSHDRLTKSFSREVIEKKPHIFKIETLTNIRGLFPQDTPFYAGFGNRETDKVSYRAVGIHEAKIFNVNPKG